MTCAHRQSDTPYAETLCPTAQAASEKVNTQLSQQVTELQDQLQDERENTQERIDFERVVRENLENMLEEERAERDRLLDEERKSRLEFEQNMMAKFTQLTQQMGTKQAQSHQTPKKMTGKDNTHPNVLNALSYKVSTSGAVGAKNNIIAPNMLMQAARLNNRQFRAMDPKI